MLHGVSCGAGMIVVSRLQAAGARMAAMWTAESHLDSCLGTQPGSFGFFGVFFWLLHVGCKDCLTAWWLGSEKEPQEREGKLPG